MSPNLYQSNNVFFKTWDLLYIAFFKSFQPRFFLHGFEIPTSFTWYFIRAPNPRPVYPSSSHQQSHIFEKDHYLSSRKTTLKCRRNFHTTFSAIHVQIQSPYKTITLLLLVNRRNNCIQIDPCDENLSTSIIPFNIAGVLVDPILYIQILETVHRSPRSRYLRYMLSICVLCAMKCNTPHVEYDDMSSTVHLSLHR